MQNSPSTIILTGEHIQQIITHVGIDAIMDELIEATYQAFVNYDSADSVMKARSGFNYAEPNEGLVEWMPIRKIGDNELVIKVVGYHPRNPELHQIPTILSTISKYDTKTGHLMALVDGVLPTSLRTGAVSAVASKLFGKKESEIMGLIGCGAQSITQLHGISRMFDLKEVYYYDIDPISQQSFESRVAMLNLDCSFIPSTINEILRQSDILTTGTSIGIGEGPLFENAKTKDWLHINAIGSDFPGKFEIPLSFLKKSYVCPDWIKQATIEGECQQLSESQIGESLFNCLKDANKHKNLKGQLTVFDSTGLALQDLVVSTIFLNHAKAMNIGKALIIENESIDEKNPYSFLTTLKKS